MKDPRSKTAGFSLIELLVSLSLFTIVMTMAVGTLLVLIDANAKAQNIQASFTNVVFALDSMTRELRTGTKYYCRTAVSAPTSDPGDSTDDCATFSENANYISVVEGGSSLTGADNRRVHYYYDDDYALDGPEHGVILRRIDTGPWNPLTSREVDIQSFGLLTSGAVDVDVQPTALVVIEGLAGDLPGVDTSFVLQSFVTQRVLDL